MIQGKVYVTKSLIDDLANAIDTRGGTTGGGTLAQLKTKVQNIPGGGGPTYSWDDDVVFMDYDGTIVTTYTAAEFAQLTELPANPTHEGLTAEGWNWTLSEAKTYVAANGSLIIGQQYRTTDGKTRAYITVNAETPRILMYLVSPNGEQTATVNWGDGTEQTYTVQTAVGMPFEHIYAAAGDYVITIQVNGQYLVRLGHSNTQSFISATTTSGVALAQGYGTVTKVEIGDKPAILVLGDNNLALKTISVPSTSVIGRVNNCGLTALVLSRAQLTIYQQMLYYCKHLKYLSIPPTVTNLASSSMNYAGVVRVHINNWSSPQALSYNFGLRQVTINSLDTLKTSSQMLYECRALEKVRLPSNMTHIESSTFGNSGIGELTVPATVTNIASSAFSGCRQLAKLKMLPTSPPALANTNAFSNCPALIIEVPYSADHSVLAAYKTATNWSTYANRMVESEAS